MGFINVSSAQPVEFPKDDIRIIEAAANVLRLHWKKQNFVLKQKDGHWSCKPQQNWLVTPPVS